MTSNQALVLTVLIVAVVAIVLLIRNGRSSSVKFKAGNVSLDAKGSNEPVPGATIKGAKSGGEIVAEDQTGRGATIEDVEAKGDVRATNIPKA